MDVGQQSGQELYDLIIGLAASLKEEDLDDPATFALCSQLISMLDPKPAPLPQEVVDQLQQIPGKADRFRGAIQMLGVADPKEMQALSDSLKAAGLLKTDSYGIGEKLKTLRDKIKNG